MKTYIKHNFTLLKGYSYTSKLLNNYKKYFATSASAPQALALTALKKYNLLIIGTPGASHGVQAFRSKRNECGARAGYKKYYHNHPVSKLEKIIKKMNEKNLILPTPRENINNIFKANKINKVEIDKLLKFKRISNTPLLSKKFKTIKTNMHRKTSAASHGTQGTTTGRLQANASRQNRERKKTAASATAPDFKQVQGVRLRKVNDRQQTLIFLSKRNTSSLEKNIQNAGVNNAAVFKKKFNLLKNLLYYNSSHVKNKPYLFNNLFEAIFNNQVLSSGHSECCKKVRVPSINTTIAVHGTLPHTEPLLSQDHLPLPSYEKIKQDSSHLLTSIKTSGLLVRTRSTVLAKHTERLPFIQAFRIKRNECGARKLINKTKKNIISLTKTIPKTLINKKKIDPFKKRYVDYVTLQIKRKLFYARMSKLVNRIKKKYKIFAYEAKIEALKIINTGKGSRLDYESILIEEKNRRGINSNKKIIKRPMERLPIKNKKIKNNRSKSTKFFALKNIKKVMKYNNNLIQKKEKNFILCSKNNILVTHVISKYNQMANKPKRKRNKRRGKLIKEKMRHRFYYPFLTKINIKGYLYTTSFIRYEDQVNILYKLYLAKILKYKFKYLSSFDYIMKNSKRSLRTHNKRLSLAYGTQASRKRKAIAITLVDSTLIKAMKKRIQKRIKKGKRSKRIIRFIDNYYRYAYPKNGIKFNLLKIPRYKWYTLKIRKHYINKRLKFALNKYNNNLNLNLLKNYNKHLHRGSNFWPYPFYSLCPASLTRFPEAVAVSRIKEIGSSNRETKALFIRRIKKNYLIKTAVQRWLKLNTEKKLLKLHESTFNNYSYYTNLNSFAVHASDSADAFLNSQRTTTAHAADAQQRSVSLRNTLIRINSSSISLEKKEFLKNFLINDWLNKENLVKDNYIFKYIKNELVSNYFLNKIFARKFKSFDSLSYEPKFFLDLLPYQMIDFFKHFAFHDSEAMVSTLDKAVPAFLAFRAKQRSRMLYVHKTMQEASTLINTSIEYSVPIHFGTQMTINLFRNLIDKQKATKAKSKHKRLLTFSLKGNILKPAAKTRKKKKLSKNKLYTTYGTPANQLAFACRRLGNGYVDNTSVQSGQVLPQLTKRTYEIYGMLAYLTSLHVLAAPPHLRQGEREQEHTQGLRNIRSVSSTRTVTIESLQTGEHNIKLILNILLLKEIEKNNRFKFINNFKTLALACFTSYTKSLQKSPKNSTNLLSLACASVCYGTLALSLVPGSYAYRGTRVALPLQVPATTTERLQDIKLKNIVKVIQKLNLLKKIKLIRKIKEIIYNKNKQFYLERLVNNINVYNFREKINVLASGRKTSKLGKQVFLALVPQHIPNKSKAAIKKAKKRTKKRAKITKVKNIMHTASLSLCKQSKCSAPTASSTVERTKHYQLPATLHYTAKQTERRSHQQHLGLRKLLLKSKLKSLQHIQSNNKVLGREIITYNFNQNARRFNIFNSFDFTGSLVAFGRSHGLYLNISVLIKYFFKTIGGAITSKPLFIFNYNKITIKFFYYLSKNIYFFNTVEKNKLLFLWLKNSKLEPDYSIINKYSASVPCSCPTAHTILTKNPNIPFKWTTLKNYSTNKALQNSYLASTSSTNLNQQHLLRNNIIASNALPASHVSAIATAHNLQAQARKQAKGRRRRAKKAESIMRKHMREVRNKRKATKKARLTKYFLRKNNILENFKKEINAFTYILESYFNCSIQLEITRLKYPFYNSNILSQLIGLNGRKYGYEQVLKKLFPKIYIRNPNTTLTKYDLSPKRKKALVSYLSGIKLKIAGRFYRHKIIPKKTVKTYQRGSLQRGVINFVESSKYINKSKRGSFCITLTLSHIF